MKKTPLARATERFESKEKLVSAVQKLAASDFWLDRINDVKGLGRVSNAKLLRLHDILSDAQKRFGSRQKLVDQILELAKRSKDKGYATRLERFPLPRLIDLHGSLSRTAKHAEAKAKAPAKKAKKAVAKPAAKPVAKKAASKPPASKKPAKKK